ncbi:hypothetical protein [Rhizobium chutanense]|uniref:hypothetical protein n=1 Tax=Rhizobium chutanense TaxID=2035448 RepID=UPI0015CF3DEC|nr:hypothetical protein [Rhizobium chutanense]
MNPSPGPGSSPGAIVGVANTTSVIGEKNTHKNAVMCGSQRRRVSIRAMKIADTGLGCSKQRRAKAQGIRAGLSGNADRNPSGGSEVAIERMSARG